jgi:hypothetical protein
MSPEPFVVRHAQLTESAPLAVSIAVNVCALRDTRTKCVEKTIHGPRALLADLANLRLLKALRIAPSVLLVSLLLPPPPFLKYIHTARLRDGI